MKSCEAEVFGKKKRQTEVFRCPVFLTHRPIVTFVGGYRLVVVFDVFLPMSKECPCGSPCFFEVSKTWFVM